MAGEPLRHGARGWASRSMTSRTTVRADRQDLLTPPGCEQPGFQQGHLGLGGEKLRFTLHRPGHCTHVSTRCHRSSTGGLAPRDIACRVHVGVAAWSTLLRACRRVGCAKRMVDGLTGPRCGGVSGPRPTSRAHAAGRHWLPSRTTSPTRNVPTSRGLLPAPKDRASAPDHR